MPTYDYVCRDCGNEVEVVRSFSDPPLTVCEACGGQLRKKFSAASIVFKGSGWHIKDYAAKGAGGNGAGKDSKEDAKSDVKTDAGSDTKSSDAPKDTQSKRPASESKPKVDKAQDPPKKKAPTEASP